jgi:hypothetical protein
VNVIYQVPFMSEMRLGGSGGVVWITCMRCQKHGIVTTLQQAVEFWNDHVCLEAKREKI